MTVKSKDDTAEIRGTEGMGTFMNVAPGNPMARRAAAPRNVWEAELASRRFFLLRVIGYDNTGNQTMQMEPGAIDTSPPRIHASYHRRTTASLRCRISAG